ASGQRRRGDLRRTDRLLRERRDGHRGSAPGARESPLGRPHPGSHERHRRRAGRPSDIGTPRGRRVQRPARGAAPREPVGGAAGRARRRLRRPAARALPASVVPLDARRRQGGARRRSARLCPEWRRAVAARGGRGRRCTGGGRDGGGAAPRGNRRRRARARRRHGWRGQPGDLNPPPCSPRLVVSGARCRLRSFLLILGLVALRDWLCRIALLWSVVLSFLGARATGTYRNAFLTLISFSGLAAIAFLLYVGGQVD